MCSVNFRILYRTQMPLQHTENMSVTGKAFPCLLVLAWTRPIRNKNIYLLMTAYVYSMSKLPLKWTFQHTKHIFSLFTLNLKMKISSIDFNFYEGIDEIVLLWVLRVLLMILRDYRNKNSAGLCVSGTYCHFPLL